METRKKCYISVPMEGREFARIQLDVDDARIGLESKGYEVLSPIDADVNRDLTQPLPVLMGNDIRALLECEAFCYIGTDKEIPHHKGCLIEFTTANVFGKEIVEL